MPQAPAPSSPAPELPFRFIAGHPAVDFANTVVRTGGGPAQERITDYGRLLAWAESAGIVASPDAARLRARAASSPRAARQALETARGVREVLRRVFECVVSGRRAPEALQELDALVRAAQQHLVLERPKGDAAGAALRWAWRGVDERLDAVLWPVLRAAAELLTSPDAAKLRMCGNVDCGWLYVDRSRNGLRRWCEMEVCGTREKSRRRAERHRHC